MPIALVVEDDRQMADSICQMLTLLGVPANPAYGPRAAMLIINDEQPDILFLDINMPGLDGFEVLAYIRRFPGMDDIPVIVVTSDDQPETQQRASEMGIKHVMIKPVSLSDLENVLVQLKFK